MLTREARFLVANTIKTVTGQTVNNIVTNNGGSLTIYYRELPGFSALPEHFANIESLLNYFGRLWRVCPN